MTRKWDPEIGQFRDSGKFGGNDQAAAAGGLNTLQAPQSAPHTAQGGSALQDSGPTIPAPKKRGPIRAFLSRFQPLGRGNRQPSTPWGNGAMKFCAECKSVLNPDRGDLCTPCEMKERNNPTGVMAHSNDPTQMLCVGCNDVPVPTLQPLCPACRREQGYR